MADAIRKLIEAVEAGRDDSEKWHPALGEHGYTAMMAFHGDLNAAKALHDALLPGFAVHDLTNSGIDRRWHAVLCGDVPPHYFSANDADPARAWLLAILRAMEAEGRG